MRKKSLLAASALLVAALTLTACGTGEGTSQGAPATVVTEDSAAEQAGTVLDTPFTKPDIILTDTNGKDFDLRERTAGKPTLLYFGYTNCPDACPLAMSNIAIAKKELSKADQEKLQVVFVSTDPEHDTPKVLGEWLKGQDPDFIGLTGDFATIQGGARTVGISIDEPTKDKNGKRVSMHGTQVIAFSPKTDTGYVLYGEQTTPEVYTKDLPKIITGAKP